MTLCSQNFLRCQNNKTNYNLVCETLQFLDIMCGSTTGGLGLLGLYINESNVHLIIQTLETLTEYCQGPCQENQVLQHTVRPKVSEQSLFFKQSLCGGQFRSCCSRPSPAFFIGSKPWPTHFMFSLASPVLRDRVRSTTKPFYCERSGEPIVQYSTARRS